MTKTVTVSGTSQRAGRVKAGISKGTAKITSELQSGKHQELCSSLASKF